MIEVFNMYDISSATALAF